MPKNVQAKQMVILFGFGFSETTAVNSAVYFRRAGVHVRLTSISLLAKWAGTFGVTLDTDQTIKDAMEHVAIVRVVMIPATSLPESDELNVFLKATTKAVYMVLPGLESDPRLANRQVITIDETELLSWLKQQDVYQLDLI